jgi:glycosyltransferase involved in cell wall biosynthesis
VRDELGAGPGTIVVGMVGRMVAEKGYPELFEAAAQLDGRYVVAAIGPDDPAKPDAVTAGQRAAAERAGVVFLGQRDDVERLYAAMDVFVLPSHREGFPRAAMEAAATGLPIVATDVRGCRQVVDDGVTGLLVPVRDPSRLASAIAALGADAELRRRMGAAAAQKARSSFDERRVVDIVLSTYADVARRRGLDAALPELAQSAQSAQLAAPA